MTRTNLFTALFILMAVMAIFGTAANAQGKVDPKKTEGDGADHNGNKRGVKVGKVIAQGVSANDSFAIVAGIDRSTQKSEGGCIHRPKLPPIRVPNSVASFTAFAMFASDAPRKAEGIVSTEQNGFPAEGGSGTARKKPAKK